MNGCTIEKTVTTSQSQTFDYATCSEDAVLNLQASIITSTTPNIFLLQISVIFANITINISYNTVGFTDVTVPVGSQLITVSTPPPPTSNTVKFKINFNNNQYTITLVGTPSATSITLSIEGIVVNGVQTGSGQITALPSDLGCDSPTKVSPYISIFFVLDNTYLQDIAYTSIIVGDCKHHQCGLGKYSGYTQSPYKPTPETTDGFSLFYIVKLNIGDAIIGSGTLTEKIELLNLGNQFLLYALFKFILGRLVFCELNLKWLYRQNYKKLLRRTSKTIYKNTIPYLLQNKGFEVYFKYSPNDC